MNRKGVQSLICGRQGALFLLLSIAPLSWGQNDRLTARELFYAAASGAPESRPSGRETRASVTSRVASKPGGVPDQLRIRDGVLKQLTDGRFAGVNVYQNEFHEGDAIRIQIETNRDAFLCLLQKGSSGAWSLLYPSAGDAGGYRIFAYKPLLIPSSPGRFTFDGRAGTENVYVIVSQAPIDATPLLLSLNAAGRRGDATQLSAVAGEGNAVLRQIKSGLHGTASRDLLLEESKERAAKDLDETVFYASSTEPAANLPSVIQFKLTHSVKEVK